ncbi:MAG: hypothetical protein WBC78_00285, partial [Candidatus Sulfotelmatobacter sp.]
QRGERHFFPDVPISEIPRWAREVRDIHKPEIISRGGFTSILINTGSETPRPTRNARKVCYGVAPKLVMGLWTACTRLKIRVLTSAYFSLTEKIEGVQQDCSLTAS